MEVESGVTKMRFDGAFGAIQTGCDVFDRQFFFVIELKDPFADRCQLLDSNLEVFPEFLTLKVSAWRGMRLCDAAFINGM